MDIKIHVVKLFILNFAYNMYVLSMLVSNEDIVIYFNLSKKMKCLAYKWADVVHKDVSLRECVLNCGQRSECIALNYKREFLQCELFSTTVVKALDTFDQARLCVALKKEDMTITAVARNCNNCREDQTCDLGHCRKTVCPKIQIEHGTISGNMNEVGSRVEYFCDNSYTGVTREKHSTCEADGSWTHAPKCIRDCQKPVTYPNSTVTRGLTTEGTVRTYICDNFYKMSIDSNNTQTTCTSNGEWTEADFRCVLDYQYLGCFNDSTDRILEVGMFNFNLTPEFCVEHCFSLGYNFSLTEASHHCFCGNQMAYTNKTEENECNSACGGASDLTCGGRWRGSVFRKNTNSKYLGCYRDLNPSRILTGNRVVDEHQQMTANSCIDLCRKLGYKFAATQFGNECYCGAVVLKVDKRVENECNVPCSGNRDEFCGGHMHASIYTTDLI